MPENALLSTSAFAPTARRQGEESTLPLRSRAEPPRVTSGRGEPLRFDQRVSQLMTRYGAGDDQAFPELYGLLRPRLGRVCSASVKPGEVDDVLQEVFMKLHRHRATFVPDGNALAWSYAVARKTCIDRLRQPARRREVPTEQARLESRSTEWTPDTDGAEVSTTVELRLAFLSEGVRASYVLVKLRGLSCAEAATALGTTPGAIKQRVHRANAELRAELHAAGLAASAVKRTRDNRCADA